MDTFIELVVETLIEGAFELSYTKKVPKPWRLFFWFIKVSLAIGLGIIVVHLFFSKQAHPLAILLGIVLLLTLGYAIFRTTLKQIIFERNINDVTRS